MNDITKLATVRTSAKKQEVIEILEGLLNTVKEADAVGDMTLLIKLDGAYTRYSSSIDDIMAVIAQYELAKFDALNRMTQ